MKNKLTLSFIWVILATIGAIAQPYKRIISLSPAATFNLVELGCEENVVGCTNYCDLSGNEDLIVASAISMNMEKVVMLKSDAVIYTTMFKPGQIDRIKQLGIHTELFASPKNYKETCEQFIRLGELVGKKERAIAYIDSCNHIMDSVKATIPKGETPKMFIEIGANPLFAAIPGTFMHDYIEIMGGENIITDGTHGTVSREMVLKNNPDVIVIVTMGIVSAEEKGTWESYAELSATKKNKVLVMDASLTCRATPHNFLNTIIEMKRLIYGD